MGEDARTSATFTPEALLGRPLNDIEQKFASEKLFVSGRIEIPLPQPRVSIVGARKATSEGLASAKTIARSLVQKDVVVVSGLAEGIDTAAHEAAIKAGGKTVAVLGTPLNKTFPAKNFALQQEIMRNHLAVSHFANGHPTQPKDFVLRNRTMALLSNASVIVEAGETSGSLHHGWEALRLGRSLFIWKAVLENGNQNQKLLWPKKMIEYGAMVLEDPSEIMDVLPSKLAMPNIFS